VLPLVWHEAVSRNLHTLLICAAHAHLSFCNLVVPSKVVNSMEVEGLARAGVVFYGVNLAVGEIGLMQLWHILSLALSVELWCLKA
jgi:hypothetical protein